MTISIQKRFGKHFETPLLIQSIVMIMAMFILLELCVRVRNSNLIIKQKRRYFSGKFLITVCDYQQISLCVFGVCV